jgi:hypothetical protein
MYKKDEARFWIMRFEQAGEMLPLHNHPVDRQHMTLCIQGQVFCHGQDFKWHKMLNPGDVFEFPENEAHCIVAMTDNTILAQINLTPSRITDTAVDDKYLDGFNHFNPIANLRHINNLLNNKPGESL